MFWLEVTDWDRSEVGGAHLAGGSMRRSVRKVRNILDQDGDGFDRNNRYGVVSLGLGWWRTVIQRPREVFIDHADVGWMMVGSVQRSR